MLLFVCEQLCGPVYEGCFLQKNDIAKNVEEELEKVNFLYSFLIATIFVSLGSSLKMLSILQP
jgi:hypothetical protein